MGCAGGVQGCLAAGGLQLFPEGGRCGEGKSLAVISGMCITEMLGWEKEPLIQHRHGLHPAHQLLLESVLEGLQGMVPRKAQSSA